MFHFHLRYGSFAELTNIQSTRGLTSEQQNTLSHMDFTISGIGLMIEHGTRLVELREELCIQVLW
jgi:Zn-dependent oligopeptidase